MRNIVLVALREYFENVKTKGFWIGLLMFPVLITLGFKVPMLLEKKGIPTRNFILADPSGQFEPIIMSALNDRHDRTVLKELHEYLRQNTVASDTDGSLDELLAKFAPGSPAGLDEFRRQGGAGPVGALFEPYLKEDAPPFVAPRMRYSRVELGKIANESASISDLVQDLRPYLRGEKQIEVDGQQQPLFAAVLIPEDTASVGFRSRKEAAEAEGTAGVQYWSVNLADRSLYETIEGIVNAEVRRREYVARGLDPAVVAEVERSRVPIVQLNPKKEEGEERVQTADMIRQFAPTAFVYVLWVALFSVSQMLLNNTIEEKSNKIIEVLLSSLTSGQLMMGKLMGIGAIGITLVGTWAAVLIGIVMSQSGPESEVVGQAAAVLADSNLIPAFICYFILGYVLYAGVFLAIGSICNTIKEAQNFMAVIMMVMCVPLLTMFFIPKDPHGALAVVLSWVPPFTPFVMMNRIAADPPFYQLAGTLVVLLLSIVLVLWLSAKIFRIGILRSGQPPKITELVRWLWH